MALHRDPEQSTRCADEADTAFWQRVDELAATFHLMVLQRTGSSAELWTVATALAEHYLADADADSAHVVLRVARGDL